MVPEPTHSSVNIMKIEKKSKPILMRMFMLKASKLRISLKFYQRRKVIKKTTLKFNNYCENIGLGPNIDFFAF